MDGVSLKLTIVWLFSIGILDWKQTRFRSTHSENSNKYVLVFYTVIVKLKTEYTTSNRNNILLFIMPTAFYVYVIKLNTNFHNIFKSRY